MPSASRRAELIKITEFRQVLECYAARQAANLATAEDLDELQAVLDEMDQPGLEYMEAIRHDFEFHRKLVEIAGNELMVNVLQVVRDLIIAAMVHTTPQTCAIAKTLAAFIWIYSRRCVPAMRTRPKKPCGATWTL